MPEEDTTDVEAGVLSVELSESSQPNFDSSSGPWTFNGVVVQNEEKTNGEKGRKYWPSESVEQSAGTLSGKPVVNGHTYDENGKPRNEDVIGRVERDAYDPNRGWLYQMKVTEPTLAKKLHDGILDVSIHGFGAAGDEVHEGYTTIEKMAASDLAVVPLGGAGSNSAQLGELPEVAMSSGEIEAALSAASDGHVPDDFEVEQESEQNEADAEEADPEINEETMTEEETQNPEIPDLEGKVVVEESRHTELVEAEDELETVLSKKDALETELESQKEQVEQVETVLAEALSSRTGHSADFYTGNGVEALKVELERVAENDLSEEIQQSATPDVQTGGNEEQEPTEEVELSSEDESRIADLQEEIEQHRAHGWDAAADALESEVAEIKGE